jgi:hypothetical protein
MTDSQSPNRNLFVIRDENGEPLLDGECVAAPVKYFLTRQRAEDFLAEMVQGDPGARYHIEPAAAAV